MKPQNIIPQIITLFKSTFENVHIIGLLGIIFTHTFFLIEIVEFVGFNFFRIIFSMIWPKAKHLARPLILPKTKLKVFPMPQTRPRNLYPPWIFPPLTLREILPVWEHCRFL